MKDRRPAETPGALPDEMVGISPRPVSSFEDPASSSPTGFPGPVGPSVAVVGGGAAGMMAAISAAEAGARVTVFDKNERAGRKLGITGKGRCNLTNCCTVPAFLENVLHGERFLYPAARFFPPEAVMDYFEKVLHVPLKTERGNRVFPQSDRAGDVVFALVRRMRRLGCVYLHDRVTGIAVRPSTADGRGVVEGVFTAESPEKALPFDRVIVCTGGASYPSTGSTGDGFRFASALGLDTVPLSPSLVPIRIKEPCCREMQGLSLRNVTLRLIDGERGKTLFSSLGEMLFTHFGITGPLVLSASAHLPADEALLGTGRFRIELDLKPGLEEQALDRRLQNDFVKYHNRDFRHALSDLLPSGMIPVMVRLSGIPGDKKVHSVLREERARLLSLFKHFSLTVLGTRPMDEAVVTRGGISVKEIDPRTMETKKYAGLYFAGEVLDVDAYTGGYNLQIAFCTGRLAGKKAAETGRESAKNPSSL